MSPSPRNRRLVAGGVVVGVAVAGIVALVLAHAQGESAIRRVTAAAGGGEGSAAERNTTRADYIGPDACGECHAENHDRWRHGLHAAMNARADGAMPDGSAAVRGDFAGGRIRYGGGEATFSRDRDGYLMTLSRPPRAPRRFRVTRTIGSRYLQEYVGVEIGPAADGTEIRLPFGYWLSRAGWYPQPYFDSWFPAEYAAGAATPAFDPFFPDPSPWAARCAWCHNTYPFALRIARSDTRGIGHGLEQRYRGSSSSALADDRLPVDQLVTLGISCESCHLGGRAHAEGAPISFLPRGPELARRDLDRALGGRRDPDVVNAICAQCHSTPAPRYPDSAAARNSSEALDLAAGSCTGIACTDCHDPHEAGPGPGAADQPAHLAACARCHSTPADHARHAAADASCLDCHMPRIVQGISAFVRTHRISSPADPAMLGGAGVNACNLCHFDRSIAWTAEQLAIGWGVTGLAIAPDERAAGEAWLASPLGAIRIAAAHAYARREGRAAIPQLLPILDDPIAFYRMWTLLAVEAALGRRLTPAEYDPLAPPARRAAQARSLAGS